MSEKVKIYLGDLTYDTISLSTEAFPLNIGYIASYCLEKFSNDVEIKLFKYVEELERAIYNAPPDILGLSNYAWNHRISLEMFRIAKNLKKDILTIWGGPNFPVDFPSQQKFMKKFPEVDCYIPLEGEIGFRELIKNVVELKTLKPEVIFKEPLEGCVTRNQDGDIKYAIPLTRMKDLDEIPSPYLTGLMDKFFDGKLSPTIQTNRGCPFSCTFCVDGNNDVRVVNQFSLKRISDELQYIGKHVPQKTSGMIISDLNFGMYSRDLDICDEISKIQEKYDYPKNIQASTGKNQKNKIIKAIRKLNGALFLWMSVQSMDQQVLKNVKRDNISLDHMLDLAPEIKKSDLQTSSEVILGLPGDSYESHIKTLRSLIDAKLDHISVYTCMLLDGSEMNTPEHRKKWDFLTRFRIIPRDFVQLSNGKVVVEIEEIVVGTNTLTFEEYVDLRNIAFSIYVTKMGIIYDGLIKYMFQKGIDIFPLFEKTVRDLDNAPIGVKEIFDRFEKSTRSELWENPEDIEKFYQKLENYQKLLNGEEGINIIQYFHAVVLAQHMDEWTEYIFELAKEVLSNNQLLNEKSILELSELKKYSLGLSEDILSVEKTINTEYEFLFDIKKWLDEGTDQLLDKFKLETPCKIRFELSSEQIQLIKDRLEVFGNTPVGKAQAIKRIPVQLLWRKPILKNN